MNNGEKGLWVAVCVWIAFASLILVMALNAKNGVESAVKCDPWVRAAVQKTVHEERYRAEEQAYQAYERGWRNAAMGTCAP